MALKTTNKNQLCALAINSGIDILLTENLDLQTVDIVTAALKDIFKNIMPFLRGEKDAEKSILAAVKIIEKTKSEVNLPSQVFVNSICKVTKWQHDGAYIVAIPAIIRLLSQALSIQREAVRQDESFEGRFYSPLITSLTNVTNVLCRGETAVSASKQLDFINDILGVKVPEFIGDQACQEITDLILAFADDNLSLNRTIIEEFVYRIFHKVRLCRIIEYCTQKRTKKHAAILNELTEKYAAENPEIFIDDPFYAKKQERSVFVKGLQKYTLETLVLTKKFLEEHGLRFYLTEGTLLGAVRHNGFIPWDDDVDIAMPREDYDKLVELANQGLIPPELNFDSLENNPKHWVLGAKMQLVRKTPYIQHKVTELSKCNGPYVDIFPLDYWSRPAGFKFSVANICVKASRRLLFMKTGYSPATKGKPWRIVGRMILPFVSNRQIEKFAIKNMKKFYKGSRKYAVNLCSYYPYYKEIFPRSFFGDPVYINFEGELMPVPCEYDYMLKTVYGKSYDTIPPVRVTNMRKHAFELSDEIH